MNGRATRKRELSKRSKEAEHLPACRNGKCKRKVRRAKRRADGSLRVQGRSRLMNTRSSGSIRRPRISAKSKGLTAIPTPSFQAGGHEFCTS